MPTVHPVKDADARRGASGEAIGGADNLHGRGGQGSSFEALVEPAIEDLCALFDSKDSEDSRFGPSLGLLRRRGYDDRVRDHQWAACFAFAFFALGASPSHYWLDSGELGAAGVELGVMHPTGVPGFVPALHWATALPIGTLGLRMALVSAVFGAWSIGILVVLLRRRRVHRAICVGVAVWVCVGLTFVRNARVVEIYTFGAWLMMVVIWGLDSRIPATKRTAYRLIACMAGSWACLGFGDLRLGLGLPIVVLWSVALWKREPWARWAPLVVVLATLVVFGLPLCSARAPVTDWGDPDTLGRLWDHLQARSIRDAYEARVLPVTLGPWWHELGHAGGRLAEDLGPFGPAIAAGGLLVWLRESRDRRASILVFVLVVVELVYVVGVNPMGGDDRQTGLPLALLAGLCVGVSLGAWTTRQPRASLLFLPLCAVMLILPSAWVSARDLEVTASWMPAQWTREVLKGLPPGTMLLTQSDSLSAGILASQVIEGARPDVVSIPGQHLYHRAPDAREDDRGLTHVQPAAEVWSAAEGEVSEAARVESALAAWRGPTALESPGVSVFSNLNWAPTVGQIPVFVREADSSGAENLASLESDDVLVSEFIERWQKFSRTAVDRRTVASALGRHARWQVARAKGSATGILQTARTYRRTLEDVEPRHVASLVALAALLDRMGDPRHAEDLTRRALEIEADRPIALTNLALYLARDPQKMAEARSLAQRAVETRPDLVRGWIRLREICSKMADPECIEEASLHVSELGAR